MQQIPMQPKANDFCPHCQVADSVIYHTERFSATYVIRYHVCRGCGGKFKTEEQRQQK